MKSFKKIVLYLLLIIVCLSFAAPKTHAWPFPITGNTQNTTSPVPVAAQTGTSASSSDSTYTLLAPIGDLKTVSNTGTCASDPSASNGIGCYLNTIFKIGIGLCGALAVIMIVIGGIQYMGTESVFGKTEAKGRIMSSILGLFIALGAYALLYTINPDLTGQNGVTVDQVTASLEETAKIDSIETQDTGGGTGTSKLCSSVGDCKALCTKTSNGSNYTDSPPGVMNPSLAQNIGNNIPYIATQAGCINCTASSSVIQGLKNIKPSVDTMIAQNKIPNRKYGFTVVSAYRPAKDQIRIMCTYIDSNPAGLGKTYAYPAKSNHGVGTAVDLKFSWNGSPVTNCGSTRDEGTIEKIMDAAGFQRLVGEAWHFEIGGKQTCKYPSCPPPKKCSV